MKINKKAFFLGLLSGMLAPTSVTANVNQAPRKIPSLSSYERLSNEVKNDRCQMQEDFYAAGGDIRRSMNCHG